MTDDNDILALLERYYEGDTTLAEEAHLREYFQRDDLPETLRTHAATFRFLADLRLEQPATDFAFALPPGRDNDHLPAARSWPVVRPLYRQLAAGLAWLVVGFGVGWWARTAPAATPASPQATALQQTLSFDAARRAPASERIRAVNQTQALPRADPATLQLLLNALNFDQNVNVRLAACEALLRFGYEPAVREGFLHSLPAQTDPRVQMVLIEALTTLREKRALPTLRQLSQNPAALPLVRQRANATLGTLI